MTALSWPAGIPAPADLQQVQSLVARLARALAAEGLEVSDPHPVAYGLQLRAGPAVVTVYGGKKGLRVTVSGKRGLGLVEQVEALVAEVLGDGTHSPEESARGEAAGDRQPGVAGSRRGDPDAPIDRVFDAPWIGSDEAGKGDYFGPLAVAAVYCDRRTGRILDELGVRDSKKLGGRAIEELAGSIRQVVGPQGFEVLAIAPARYNQLYEELRAEGKSLNSLLAWGHARVLEALLERFPGCRRAVTDRFGDERLVASRLERRGAGVDLVQVPRAEHNVAVAAASILARRAVLRWIEEASRRYGFRLPLGASAAVVEAGRRLVQASGREELGNAAKLHFRTTEAILGAQGPEA